ncbi:MAG TPA: class I SAM-dependent methyltransferase, partial [Candidatus Limnocylindria bacterium]|nr:class I SAM-dependent methyltransferase [Candidatus Limnocylindria bacterium]
MMLLGWFLNRLIRIGTLTVIDAGGRIHRFGGGEPAITVQLHDPKLTRRLFFQPELAAGAAYMDGTLTIENATLYDFLDLIGRNYAHGGFSGLDGPFDRFRRPLHWFSSFNSRRRSRKNAVHHYDLSGALYDLFLDRERHYSCAYFIDESDRLEEAQQQKCRHIAAKLLLKPGMRVLDIGSGWGGMALYLAKRFGAEVVDITLSDEQLKVAQQRAQKAQVGLRACFFLRDYREEEGSYDRIVSVGM